MQGNTFQIPIVPTQRTNASFEKTKTVPKKDPRLKHLKKVCLSYINISSVTNKLETLLAFVCTQVDFLAISETKLDSSFPTVQFNFPSFRTPYRKDTTARSGGLLVYVNGDIPSRMIFIRDCPSDIQILPVQKTEVVSCSNIYTTFTMEKLIYYRTNEGFRQMQMQL